MSDNALDLPALVPNQLLATVLSAARASTRTDESEILILAE